MKKIFRFTGIDILYKETEGFNEVKVFIINNSDGSIRWIWNSKNKNPDFLKFYAVNSIKSKVYSVLINGIFTFNLQNLFFASKKIYYHPKEQGHFFDIESEWSLFTGTVGPNNKLVLYVNNHFYKIPTSEISTRLIENEYCYINKLNNNDLCVLPNVSLVGNILKLSDVSTLGKRTSGFTNVHAEVVKKIALINHQKIKIADWSFYQEIKKQTKEILDNRIPKNIIRKLICILQDTADDEEIETSLSHGDFTSWNCFVMEQNIVLYDWELAKDNAPKGFDFFHFIIQSGILTKKLSWKEIYSEILEKNKMVFNFNQDELDKYLKFYLIINISQYLKIYAAQDRWHQQIYWLLSVWNQALDMFLKEKYTSRQLIIMDFLDEIYAENYAALKFHNSPPEELSLDSDIDILVNKSLTKKIINFFEHHAFVHKVILDRKSFLKNIKIITQDYQILSIDCIEEVKWKNLITLNKNDIIKKSEFNHYGVKVASNEDTLRYLVLFYTLNDSSLPKKYENDYSGLNLLDGEIDHILTIFLNNKLKSKKYIINALLKKKSNKGFNYFKNTFKYFVDIFSGKGFIITFSGVDGAGKSTVILNLTQMIKNRYRRPSIVLRHRPAILPILSVWTKGKEKAHTDAVNSLPRQGKNNNFWSSFFRFSYYYTDYFIGQFMVYFKYVLRGYVVIYDRYYFDFIADSKRSNIVLPKSIALVGYSFLLKPKFNFFLFEDPQVILERKQELSKCTIENLTKDYTSLFRELASKDKKVCYQNIQNRDIEHTLTNIMSTIITFK